MKRLVWFMIALAIAVLAWGAISLIEYFTTMDEVIITLIASVAIGSWSCRCARWIINKITEEHDQI